jgi:hypothetical protein
MWTSLYVLSYKLRAVVAAPNEERRFFSFHDWGVSVYEPTACRLYHQIQATDIIPGTQVSTADAVTNINITSDTTLILLFDGCIPVNQSHA